MTIWKYALKVTDEQIITMPKAAKLLCVQTQYETPCLWAVVEPSNIQEGRKILIFGTGHPIDNTVRAYLGTFQLQGGALVFHVFEGIQLDS